MSTSTVGDDDNDDFNGTENGWKTDANFDDVIAMKLFIPHDCSNT